MHISEGVLSAPVLVSGMAIAAVGAGIGLKKLDYEKIAQAGILSASFFVASLIHVPVFVSKAHLILNGIVGLLLGWGAFPAILAALVLQAVFFQYGGLTTLGVNTVIMAVPAVFCFYLYRMILRVRPSAVWGAAFAGGFSSVLLSALIAGVALIFTTENFIETAGVLFIAHLPIMVIEGLVTAFCVVFLSKVRPELIQTESDNEQKQ